MQHLKLLALFLIAAVSGGSVSGEEISADEAAVPIRFSTANGWQVASTSNFRIHYGREMPRRELQTLADHLELRRQQTGTTWLGEQFAKRWSVVCDVFLHGSDRQYEQHSRMPAATVGYSRLKVGRGRVWSRRLDLRWHAETSRSLDVVSHELTHIVLADRFCWRQIPRWADEGIAIASETGARPERLAGVMREAIQSGRLFSLQELLAARAYPQDRQMADLFYAQSASLVRYLAETYGHEQVIELADSASQNGLESAIAETFPLRSAAELDQQWREWLSRTPERRATVIALDD